MCSTRLSWCLLFSPLCLGSSNGLLSKNLAKNFSHPFLNNVFQLKKNLKQIYPQFYLINRNRQSNDGKSTTEIVFLMKILHIYHSKPLSYLKIKKFQLIFFTKIFSSPIRIGVRFSLFSSRFAKSSLN